MARWNFTERLWLELPEDGLASAQRQSLIDFLLLHASSRKVRFFACACVREASPSLQQEQLQRILEGAELFAEGRLDLTRLEQLRREAYVLLADMQVSAELAHADFNEQEVADLNLCRAACGLVHEDIALSLHDILVEPFAYKLLLVEVFGNPFRPVKIQPEWLQWNRALVPRMAEELYESRRFEDCPILADALEEAGCSVHAILEHLRGPASHVRGCWVLDLLLRRN